MANKAFVLSIFVLLIAFSELVNALVRGPSHGGSGGTAFDDANGFATGEFVKVIAIRSGRRVDQVTFRTNYRVLSHGGDGGSYKELVLFEGEKIIGYDVCRGKKRSVRVFYVRFTTNKNRIVEGGRRTDDCITHAVRKDYTVFGMYGSSGKEVDRLGLIYA